MGHLAKRPTVRMVDCWMIYRCRHITPGDSDKWYYHLLGLSRQAS